MLDPKKLIARASRLEARGNDAHAKVLRGLAKEVETVVIDERERRIADLSWILIEPFQ